MLCWVVSPDFLWNFHDGLTTKSLVGPTAIREHLVEQKARFSAQRFHEVIYHDAADAPFYDVPRQRNHAGDRRTACAAWRGALHI
jgi:hypothetical protein